jgi:hypothetical protein
MVDQVKEFPPLPPPLFFAGLESSLSFHNCSVLETLLTSIIHPHLHSFFKSHRITGLSSTIRTPSWPFPVGLPAVQLYNAYYR